MKNHWNDHKFIPIRPGKSNLTLNWSDSDSEENFIKNPKVGYSKDSVIYKYNSYGYRTNEFNFTDPAILCLGCSFTEGIGVNSEQAWPGILAKHFINYNVYNLGVEGTSGDSVPRILANIKDLINVKLVFILWPILWRYEIYHEDRVQTIRSTTNDGFSSLMLTDVNFFNIKQRNKLMVSLLAQIYQYNIVEHDIEDFPLTLDQGRDTHPGPNSHKEMANMFLNKYHNVHTKI
jgi:hypothetical protein